MLIIEATSRLFRYLQNGECVCEALTLNCNNNFLSKNLEIKNNNRFYNISITTFFKNLNHRGGEFTGGGGLR